MSHSPKHRIFKLPMTAFLKVLAENGAEEAAPNSHKPSPQSVTKKQSRWLSYKELKPLKGISLSRIQLQRREDEGTFPKRIKSGARIYWWEHEIDEWKQSEAASRSPMMTV